MAEPKSPAPLPLNKLGQYKVIADIAEGTFGQVKMARHVVTGHRVAMKYISKQMINATKTKMRVQREVDYMRLLRHPHIIKLYEVINTPKDIIIVLEYAGGELFNYIVQNGRMAEMQARRFFQQLISGIDYSHRLKVVHRDLKPENVLLDDDLNVKIADFGLSNRMIDGDFFKTSCGSPNYAAPEVIKGVLYTGPEIDVWSCGVVLYVMLCGKLPFEDEDINSLFNKITQGVFQLPSYLSSDAKYIISGMLNTDPLKRLTIADILRHPFYTTDLPRYLSPLPPPPGPLLGSLSSLVATKKPDFEIIDGLGRMEDEIITELSQMLQGVSREDIWAALRREDGTQGNAVKVAYMLLRDKRRLGQDLAFFEERERDAQLAALDPKTNLSPVISPGGDPSENPFETEFAAEDDDESEDFDAEWDEESHFQVLDSSLPSRGVDQTLPSHHLAQYASARSRRDNGGKERRQHRTKWQFGMRSRSPPMEVMLEIYRTLRALGMEWKEKLVLGGLGGIPDDERFQRARQAANPDADDEDVDLKAAMSIYFVETRCRVGDTVVLMNLQLYQVDDINYLVDFQHKGYYKASIEGPTFSMARPAPIQYLVPGPEQEVESDETTTSPYLFMDVACRLIIELAGGSGGGE